MSDAMIRTFSGAHPYRPQCVLATLRRLLGEEEDEDLLLGESEDLTVAITERVTAGLCPRCAEPLPSPPEFPAGSLVTRCRCIPVCRVCAEHEGLSGLAIVKGWIAEHDAIHLWEWPVAHTRVDRELAKWEDHGERVEYALGDLAEAAGPPTGGWGEFGYDDSEDREEQER